jgi:hypothetical protein
MHSTHDSYPPHMGPCVSMVRTDHGLKGQYMYEIRRQIRTKGYGVCTVHRGISVVLTLAQN